MRRLSGLVTAALTITLLGVAPSANARQLTHHDGTGDVWFLVCCDYKEARPDQVAGDITTVQMNHRPHRVQLYTTVRALDPTAYAYEFDFELQNGRHRETNITFQYFVKTGSSRLFVEDAKTHKARKCRGPRHFKVNTTTNVGAVSLPRTCFESPSYLRFRASAYLYPASNLEHAFGDNGFSAADPLYQDGPWSKWVKRG